MRLGGDEPRRGSWGIGSSGGYRLAPYSEPYWEDWEAAWWAANNK